MVDVPDDEQTGLDPGQDWVWREDRIHDLLSTDDAEVLFLAGCAPNQGSSIRSSTTSSCSARRPPSSPSGWPRGRTTPMDNVPKKSPGRWVSCRASSRCSQGRRARGRYECSARPGGGADPPAGGRADLGGSLQRTECWVQKDVTRSRFAVGSRISASSRRTRVLPILAPPVCCAIGFCRPLGDLGRSMGSNFVGHCEDAVVGSMLTPSSYESATRNARSLTDEGSPCKGSRRPSGPAAHPESYEAATKINSRLAASA